jgi:hypothetical protein
MLVLDSLSRRSFYRSLPRTVETLKSLPHVTDFLVHNVMGEFSSNSFMPTFYGDVPWSRLHGQLPESIPYEADSVYTLMQERGFATYLTMD